MTKSNIEILDAAIAEIESGETIFSCNALCSATDFEVTGDKLIFEYTMFTRQNGKPYWWDRVGYKEERIAALKAFKEHLISQTL